MAVKFAVVLAVVVAVLADQKSHVKFTLGGKTAVSHASTHLHAASPRRSPAPHHSPAPHPSPAPHRSPAPHHSPAPHRSPAPHAVRHPQPPYHPQPSYTPKPSYKPEPAYTPAPHYKPEPTYEPEPAYKPEPAYGHPETAYRPEPTYGHQPAYQPAYRPTPAYHPEPSYGPKPAYPSHEPAVPSCAADSGKPWCLEDKEYPSYEIKAAAEYHYEKLLTLYADVADLNTELSVERPRYLKEETYLCPSDTAYVRPLRAQNTDGKWRVIVNNIEVHYETLTQTTRIEECNTYGSACPLVPVCYESKCLQKSIYHRFLVYDPYDQYFPFAIETFKLPASCACVLGAYMIDH